TKNEFALRATYGMSDAFVAELAGQGVGFGESTVARAARQRAPVQVADFKNAKPTPLQQVILRAGYRALLVMPLLSPDKVVGALVVRRKAPGSFPAPILDLLQTFAAQSVLAIQNARLFREIEDKSRQIELASRHKSQFLANMSQVLLNLLSNACKFTREGEVRVMAARIADGGRAWLQVDVADSGIGMSAEQIGKLFQEFTQADSTTSRQFGGTGLGLAISRRLCRMMGGDITVASEKGRGATFTVQLPAETAEVPARSTGPAMAKPAGAADS